MSFTPTPIILATSVSETRCSLHMLQNFDINYFACSFVCRIRQIIPHNYLALLYGCRMRIWDVKNTFFENRIAGHSSDRILGSETLYS